MSTIQQIPPPDVIKREIFELVRRLAALRSLLRASLRAQQINAATPGSSTAEAGHAK